MVNPANMTSLRQRTFSALGWNAAAQLSVQAAQFVTAVAVARLLSPQEFGLMGMVLVFTGFAAIFYDMGLGAALIQRRDLSERHVNSVFWINAGMGTLLTILFIAGAPLISWFFGEPPLRWLTVAVSLAIIPSALSVAHIALIDKALNFRARFRIETISTLASGAVAVFLALNGMGVWSLVGQSLVLAATRFVLTWRMSRWRPAWSFDTTASRELFKFSRNLLGNSAVQYWGRNIDRLILGRFMGSLGLGLYSLAFRSITLPLDLTTNVTNAVMFPAFSVIQGDIATLKRVYLQSTRMIALVTFPVMMGLADLAEPIVLLLYGNQWRASIGVIQVLAFSGMAQSVYNTAGWLFLSQGRTDIVIRLGVYATVVRACGAAAGIPWGIMGVAWAYLVGSYGFLWYPTWRNAGHQLNLGVGELLWNLAGPFFCTIGMGAAVWTCDRWMLGQFRPWLRVATGIPLGILLYGLLIYRFQSEAWRELGVPLVEVMGERFPVLRRAFGETPQSLR